MENLSRCSYQTATHPHHVCRNAKDEGADKLKTRSSERWVSEDHPTEMTPPHCQGNYVLQHTPRTNNALNSNTIYFPGRIFMARETKTDRSGFVRVKGVWPLRYTRLHHASQTVFILRPINVTILVRSRGGDDWQQTTTEWRLVSLPIIRHDQKQAMECGATVWLLPEQLALAQVNAPGMLYEYFPCDKTQLPAVFLCCVIDWRPNQARTFESIGLWWDHETVSQPLGVPNPLPLVRHLHGGSLPQWKWNFCSNSFKNTVIFHLRCPVLKVCLFLSHHIRFASPNMNRLFGTANRLLWRFRFGLMNVANYR